MDPKTQLIFVFQSGGIPLGVPPRGGGGPGRFPLAPGSRCRFVVVPSAATIAPKCIPMVDKKFQGSMFQGEFQLCASAWHELAGRWGIKLNWSQLDGNGIFLF